MQLTYRTEERGKEYDRVIRELDKRDHEWILWSFSRVLDLHRELHKEEPPLSTVELYRQPERITWLVDDVGMIFALFDVPGRASVHICFWDRVLRGREGLCRMLADFVLANWNLNYLTTMIPATSEVTLAFAKRVGFQEVARSLNGTVHLVYAPVAVSP